MLYLVQKRNFRNDIQRLPTHKGSAKIINKYFLTNLRWSDRVNNSTGYCIPLNFYWMVLGWCPLPVQSVF